MDLFLQSLVRFSYPQTNHFPLSFPPSIQHTLCLSCWLDCPIVLIYRLFLPIPLPELPSGDFHWYYTSYMLKNQEGIYIDSFSSSYIFQSFSTYRDNQAVSRAYWHTIENIGSSEVTAVSRFFSFYVTKFQVYILPYLSSDFYCKRFLRINIFDITYVYLHN